MTATLGINNRVSETLGITIELKIMCHATNFTEKILSFLAYGGSSIVKTLNQTSFRIQQMVRFEVEIPVSVGAFAVHFGGQCHLFPDDQNTQKWIDLSDSISIVNWMEGLKLLRWLRKFFNHSGP
jgi:hypothetical protein